MTWKCRICTYLNLWWRGDCQRCTAQANRKG